MSRQSFIPPAAQVAVSLRGIQRAFGQTSAVDGLSLTVHQGELFGLVGPDGAGKTTTVRIVAGLLDADAGIARVFGEPVGDRTRRRIGYMPQQYSLYGDLSVRENLTFFGRLFGLSATELRQRRRRLLNIARLSRFEDRRAHDLSGGMYKKLALSCALLHEPDLLVLDEPTNGVDPVSRRDVWDLLHEFVADGMTVIITTAYMDEASRCRRVGLIDHGRLLTQGTPAEMVDHFGHHVMYLVDDNRDQIERQLLGLDAVLAVSAQGAGLRVVVGRDKLAGVRAAVDEICSDKVEIDRVSPTFEDVFLAKLATQGHAPSRPEDGP